MREWFLSTAKEFKIGLSDASELKNADKANSAVAAFFNRIAEILLAIAIPLALAGIIFAAIALIKASGNPDGYKQAKKIILYILSGFIFIALAVVLVRFMTSLFA